MSLHFVIDGYNIIKHPLLASKNKKTKEPSLALLEFITLNKLTGSHNNKVTVVFDGYPHDCGLRGDFKGIDVIFAKKQSADERIKGILERCAGVKQVVVVSNDNQIKSFARSLGAAVLAVEEFIGRRKKTMVPAEAIKPEISYAQMHKINRELRKVWLGE